MPTTIELLEEGRHAENLGILDRALSAFDRVLESAADPVIRCEAHVRRSHVLRRLSRWDEARHSARQAVAIADEAGLAEEAADARNAEGTVALLNGDLHEAVKVFEQALGPSPSGRSRGIILQNLGAAWAQMGLHVDASRAFEESSREFAAAGYLRGEAVALNNLGRLLLEQGDSARAEAALEVAVTRARELEDEEVVATATANYAEALVARGELSRGFDLICTALGHFRTSGNAVREAECLRMLGAIEERRMDVVSAVTHYRWALELARRIDARAEIAALERILERLAPG